MGGIGEFLMGSSGGLRANQKPYYEQALNEGFGLGQNPLYQQGAQQAQQNLNSSYEDYFGPMLQQFQESTAPQLAAQFAGAGNNRSSSGVGNAIGGGLRGLGQDLASQYASMKQNALMQALQYAQAPGHQSMNAVSSLLQPFQRAPKTGLLPGIAQFASGTLGSLAGMQAGSMGSSNAQRAAQNQQYMAPSPFRLG